MFRLGQRFPLLYKQTHRSVQVTFSFIFDHVLAPQDPYVRMFGSAGETDQCNRTRAIRIRTIKKITT
jgi:hypothetical protein